MNMGMHTKSVYFLVPSNFFKMKVSCVLTKHKCVLFIKLKDSRAYGQSKSKNIASALKRKCDVTHLHYNASVQVCYITLLKKRKHSQWPFVIAGKQFRNLIKRLGDITRVCLGVHQLVNSSIKDQTTNHLSV